MVLLFPLLEAGIIIGTGIKVLGLELESEWNQWTSCWNRNRNRNQTFEFSWNRNRNQNQDVPGIAHHCFRYNKHRTVGTVQSAKDAGRELTVSGSLPWFCLLTWDNMNRVCCKCIVLDKSLTNVINVK